MFVHLLLNSAHKGSCWALSSAKAPCLALLWSLRGHRSIQQSGLTFSREGAQGSLRNTTPAYFIDCCSFQALLKAKEFWEWAAEQLFHRVWAEPFSFAGHCQHITKADPSIALWLNQLTRNDWWNQHKKHAGKEKENILFFFFFNCSSFSLETTHLHDMRSVQPLNYP